MYWNPTCITNHSDTIQNKVVCQYKVIRHLRVYVPNYNESNKTYIKLKIILIWMMKNLKIIHTALNDEKIKDNTALNDEKI